MNGEVPELDTEEGGKVVRNGVHCFADVGERRKGRM
jgi:hypothetical protein